MIRDRPPAARRRLPRPYHCPVDLDALRAALEQVDQEILDAWARRDAITAAIGRAKQMAGSPIHDASQEARVLDRARSLAAERGLPPDLAAEVLGLLIRSSLARQEDIRVRAEGQGAGRPALVIGGGGRMGRWFCRFLAAQGYAVSVADPAGGPPGTPTEADWRQTPDDFALTVVAAPLGACAEVLEGIAAERRRGLVFDIGSVKAPLAKGLTALRESGCRAASLHPMFGPDAHVLHGCHVLVMDVGRPEDADEAASVFSGTMAEILRIPLAEHDPLIAYVLGLSHALNLAFVTALVESGEQAPRLARLSSVTFDRQLRVAAAVTGDNPHLYYEIQHANPHGPGAIHHLAAAVSRLAAVIHNDDEDAFVRLMNAGRQYVLGRK